jgi:hypothetical protein
MSPVCRTGGTYDEGSEVDEATAGVPVPVAEGEAEDIELADSHDRMTASSTSKNRCPMF